MTLLLLLVRASVVLAVAFGVAHVLRHRSAALRADLWRATFVALAVLPIAMVCLPALRWLPALGGSDVIVAEATVPSKDAIDAAHPMRLIDPSVVAVESTADSALEAAAPEGTDDVAGAPAPIGRSRLDALSLVGDALVALWLVGVFTRLARLSLGLRRAASIASAARVRVDIDAPPRIAVATSETVSGPFVWDPRPFGRPTVVLPGDGEPVVDEPDGVWRRAVLAHELHHVDRRDGPFLALATVISAVYWPSPLARWALDRLRLETERAADDAVLRAGVRASDYAGGLVALAAGPAALPVPAMGASGTVSARVESLLDGATDRRATGRAARITASLVALSLSAPIASLAVAHAQEADQDRERAVAPRAEMRERALDALVAMHDTRTGAWLGDVGFKLNNDWRVTAKGVPHVGVTGLAVEALALAGETPNDTPRGRVMSAGIDFLLECQGGDGYFSANGSRMRSHAHALRALATVHAIDPTKLLAEAIQNGADFTLEAQSPETGGWRFVPMARDTDILETAHQFDALKYVRQVQVVAKLPGTVLDMNEDLVAGFPAEGLDRAYRYGETLQVIDTSTRRAVGFRYQRGEGARITTNTIAAGLVLLALPVVEDSTSVDESLVLQLNECRDHRSESLGRSEGHFLTWDAELLAERAIDGMRWSFQTGPITMRDADTGSMVTAGSLRVSIGAPPPTLAGDWRSASLDWLAAHQRPDGSWKCTTGTGDAYVTAIGCILLADDD